MTSVHSSESEMRGIGESRDADGMRGIGEMARCSGLSVSALRFYDGAGVLVPAMVDPANGYRWYGPQQVDEARVAPGRHAAAGHPLVLAG